MKMETTGQCTNCKQKCNPNEAIPHILNCLSNDTHFDSEGFIVKVSWVEQPNLYWMFLALSKDISLTLLDSLLRTLWLECCGHLSEFTINGRSYLSHTESGNRTSYFRTKIGQIFTPGMTIGYAYDMGSTTELKLEVFDIIPFYKKEMRLLMRNDPPVYPCESCKKPSKGICAYCSGTVCDDCIKDHSCVVKEGNTYMILPIVNSPRTGVCGYGNSYV